MITATQREPSVAVARRALDDLSGALGIETPRLARPGAVGLLPHPLLLRVADGWVHPGPPTARADFWTMVSALGGDLSTLSAWVIDAEAGEWLLPAVAVRSAPADAPVVPWPRGTIDVRGARIVVLGATWAAPLAGHVLAHLGAQVIRVTDPRRADPFPLRDALLFGCDERALDLGDARAVGDFVELLASSDLLVDGTTPRVLANLGLAEPPVGLVRIAAFAHDDRPGYGLAAECRGGWAARYDPPRLGRTSVADPVAALLAVLAAVEVLASGAPRARARVSLEDAVGQLFVVESTRG
jgi:hypothetical protein